MTVLAHEPFALPWEQLRLVEHPRVRSRIERVPSDSRVAKRLEEHKRLADDGWDVCALLAPDRKTVLLIACRDVEGSEL